MKGAKQPDAGAQAYVDGLIAGACADALRRTPASAAAVRVRCVPARSLALALALALTFLTLPVVAIFVDTAPAS